MRPRRVVILGAGFAGIACAKRLSKFDGEVLIVDRTNHHLFQPLLYQVATAGLSGSDIAQPIRTVLRGQRNAHVHMSSVTAIDLATRTITFSFRDHKIEYDWLVIALGVQTNYFGNDHWAKHALGLKSLADANLVRDRMLGAFERAENLIDSPAERIAQTTIVVIGGGATGVEMAGACIELARRALRPEYRRANLADVTVHLVDSGSRLLSTFDETLSARAKADLEAMGVTVHLNTRVGEVGDGYVIMTKSGDATSVVSPQAPQRIEAATIIWAAGVCAPPLTGTLGVPLDRAGRIIVDVNGRVGTQREVFAAGDIAACSDARGKLVPGVAQGAMQLGDHIGKLILCEERTRIQIGGASPARKGFTYFDKGSMATIGRSKAVAEIGSFKTGGILAWVLWLAVHLIFLVDLRSKLTVLLKWSAAYLFYRPSGRLIGERTST